MFLAKMERFTNDPLKVIAKAKIELKSQRQPERERVICYFSQFPDIGGKAYQISLIESADAQINAQIQFWDMAYDFKRWQNGIYNLDRLCILRDEKPLSPSEIENLLKIFESLKSNEIPETLHDNDAIFLDGCDWALGIDYGQIQVQFSWRAAKKEIEMFVPLIELMRHMFEQFS